MKQYTVYKVSAPIEITGAGVDPEWSEAPILEDFSYPWRADSPPQTSFRALWSQEYLFFLFEAMDPVIQFKVDRLQKVEPVDSDRVELFFKADDKMNPYYSLEMDALGRVLDTEGRFYRKIDFDWQWPSGHLEVKAEIKEGSYTVEGQISLESLRQLGMYKDDRQLQVGVYRAEYVFEEMRRVNARWISWVDPQSEQPDFHIPTSFGIFKLED